jgi:hypothetical protein
MLPARDSSTIQQTHSSGFPGLIVTQKAETLPGLNLQLRLSNAVFSPKRRVSILETITGFMGFLLRVWVRLEADTLL